MASDHDASGRIAAGLRDLVGWYLGPIGVLFGLGLVAAFVAALFDRPSLGLIFLVIDLAIVVPWKLIGQRNESRAHAQALNSAHQLISDRVEHTVTRPGLNNVVTAFRRADRQNLRKLRTRMNNLQQSHEDRFDELSNELHVLEARISGSEE